MLWELKQIKRKLDVCIQPGPHRLCLKKKKKLGSRAFSCQECVPGFYPWDWKEQRVKADDVTAPDRKAPSAGEEMETMHPCSLLWGMWTTEWLVLKNIKQHY